MADQPVPVVPKVVLSVHAPVIQQGVLASQDDLIPQNYLIYGLTPALQEHRQVHLVQLVVRRLVLGRQIQEQLLHIPVEEWVEVGMQVEGEEAQVVLLLAGGVVRHVLHDHLDCADVSVHLQEDRGQRVEKM